MMKINTSKHKIEKLPLLQWQLLTAVILCIFYSLRADATISYFSNNAFTSSSVASEINSHLLKTNNHQQQTYQSCSIITQEYISAVQLYKRGFTLDELKKSLPGLTPKGVKRIQALYKLIQQNGVLPTYSSIHSKYAACAKSVYKRKNVPPPNSTEYNFYFCAGEDKLRYEIALAIYLKAPSNEVLPQIPEQRRGIAAYYYQLAEKEGVEAVFDLLGHSLKSCLVRAMPAQ